MVKIRRGCSVNIKEDVDDRKIKEDALVASRASMVKRCDNKIARSRLQAEQREVILAEELSRAQAAVETKQEKIELAHRLAAELSRRKNEEIKCALKSERVKSFARSPSICALNEARSRLIEEKARLEASQEELLKLWHEDKIFNELQRAENEKKKQSLRDDMQKQLADNCRRVQQRRVEEKEQDRRMVERAMRKIQEEDARMRQRKENDAILLRAERAVSLAVKNAWERKYKEKLKDEDERIASIIAKKETRQETELSMKTKLHAAREAAIDNVARKLLANVCKERKKQEIADELYREEQRSKWMKESVKPARKQCAESFQEILKRKAERKAIDKATDVAFMQYLAEEQKKDIEKQREVNKAQQAKKVQYGKELKEAITNNRVTYVMDILKRQSEIRDKNSNQLIATSVKQSNNSNDVKQDCKQKEIIDASIRSYAE